MNFTDLKRYFSCLLIYFISLSFFLSQTAQAADIQAQLDNSSNPGFSVQNNGGSTVARVDSNGNLTTAGNVGVGTNSTGTLLYVGTGGAPTDVGAGDAFIQNNLEVDGTTYLDGLQMTGAGTFTGLPTFSNGTYSALFTGGNVGIGSAHPGQTLDVLGTLRTSQFMMTGQTPISGYVLTATDSLGDASWTPSTSVAGSISGLTTNFITKASSATSITNSLIFDNGTNVGINSTNPGQTLDVQGSLRSLSVMDTGVTASHLVMTDANQQFVAAVAGTNYAAATSGSNLLFGNGAGGFTNVTNTAAIGGNVGIGSTNPGATLDVQGTLRTSGFTMSGQTPVGGYVLTAVDSTGAATWSAAGSVSGWTESGANVYETSGGNVGIGSTNPGQALDVQGSIRGLGVIDNGVSASSLVMTNANQQLVAAVAGTNYAAATSGSNLLFGNGAGGFTNVTNSATVGGNIGVGSLNPGATLDVQGTLRTSGFTMSGQTPVGGYVLTAVDSTGATAWSAAGSVSGWTESGANVYETSGGNVGIGSTNPGQALDVQGSIRSLGVIDNGVSASSLVMTNANQQLVAAVAGTNYAAATSGSNWLFGNGAGGFTNVANSATNGTNVGIGSLNPGAILDVQGTLRTSGFTMSGQTPVGGYVLTAVDSAGATTWSAAGSVSGWTESGANVYETSGGNVGIGSTNPGQALDVQGSIRSLGVIDNGVAASSLVMTNANQQLVTAVAGTNYAAATSGSNLLFGNGAGGFTNVTNSATVGGNIGVGSLNPGATLDVQGTLRTSGFTMSGQTPVGGYVLTAVDSAGAATWSAAGSVSGWTESGNNVYATNPGNVGIGSANPGQALDVQGTVRAVGLTDTSIASAILKTNASGNVISAIAGTDYAAATSGSNLLFGNGAGGFTNVTNSATVGGNIGVGSANPGQILDIQGTLRSTQFTMSGQTPVGGYVLTAIDSTGATTWSSAGAVSGWTESGNNVYETNGGNVGINSTNPGTSLDVLGTIRSIGVVTNGAYTQSGVAANTFTGPSTFSNNAFFNSGNVGIGSANPGQALDVQGTVRAVGLTDTSIASAILKTNASGNVVSATAGTDYAAATSGSNLLFGNGTGGFTNVTTTTTNGTNIGVGSANPGQILDIQGTLRSTQFTMSGQTPVGGYVLTAIDSTGATTWSSAGAVSGWTESGNNVYETNGGNVGINSTNPGTSLDVQGTIRSIGVVTNGAYTQSGSAANTFTGASTFSNNALFNGGNVGINSTNPGTSLDVLGTIRSIGVVTNGAYTQSGSAANTFTGASTFSNNALFNGGNVGINSTNPGTSLDVLGTIRSIGVVTNGAYTQSGSAANTFTGASTFSNSAFFNSGNVGVGSTNPGQALDIQGTLRTTQFTMSGQTPVGGYVLTAVDSTGATTWSSAGAVSGWTESGNNVYETNGGNVGINSTNPGTSLDVQGTIRSIGVVTNGAYTQSGSAANTFTGASTFSNNAFFNSGNVGVGSTNPGQLLDVQGTVRALSFVGSGAGLTNLPAGGAAGTTNQVQYNVTGNLTGSNNFVFNGANVGIGSVNPGQTLDVGGTIRSIGVITNGAYTQSGTASNTFTGPSTFSNSAFFNSGNVGVGSTNPGQILDIQGTLRTTQFSMSGQTPVGGYVLTAVDSTGATTWAAAGAVSGWTTGTGVIYTTTASNNVGIGSSNPGQLLDVQGTVRSLGVIDNGVSASSLVMTNANQQLVAAVAGTNYAAATSGSNLLFGNGSGGFTNVANTTAAGGNIGINSANPGQILDIQGTLRTTQFSMSGQTPVGGYVLTAIDSTGAATWTAAGSVGPWTQSGAIIYETGNNVGIGSVNPAQSLDVQGTIRAVNLTDTSVASAILKTNAFGNVVSATAGTDYAAATSSSNLLFGNGSGGFTNVTNTATVGGNIGIGSANPGQILDIQGTLRTTQFSMSGQTPVGGYVLTAVDSTGATTWAAAGAVSGWTTGTGVIYTTTASNNVGIGSSNPGQLLDVQGTVRSLGVIDNGVSASSLVMTNANQQLVAAVAGTNYAAATSGSNLLFGNGSGGFTNVANTTAAGGNIGINSANPGQILDIQGTLRTTQFSMSGQTPVGGYVLTAIDSTGAATWTAAGSVGPWTQSGAIIYETGNNVGIGSVNPAQSLDVQGTIRAVNLTDTSVASAILKTNAFGNVVSATAGTDYAAATSSSNLLFGNGSGGFTNVTNTATVGGNIGIGSANPGQILDIQGTLRTTQFSMSGQTPVGGYVLTAVDSTGATTWAAAGAVSGWTTGTGVIYTTTASNNVGIGSSNPGQLLDVQGTVRSLGVIDNGVSASSLVMTNANQQLVAAVAGTNYAAATSGSNLLFGNGSGGFTNVTTTTTNGTNIGISSANPGQLLDVQGTVRSLFFVGNGSGLTGISGAVSGLTANLVPRASNSTTIVNGSLYDTGTNVGLGSTNPGQILDIQGTLRTTTFTMSGQTPVSGYVLTAVNSAGAATWTAAGSVGPWTQAGAIIDETGNNVGIGSTNPGQALDIQGTVRATGLTLTAGAASGYILETNGVGIGTWVPAPTGTATSGSNLLFGNGSGGFTNVSNTATAGGNIGIGSANPGQILDIQGTLRTTTFTMSGQTPVGGYVLTAVDSTGAATWTAAGSVGPWTQTGAIIDETGNNVGIGSTNPGQALDIQGTVRATGLTLTAGAASGYILETNGVGIGTWVPSPSGTPGGSNTQVQYDNNGIFGGSSNFIFNGTNVGLNSASPGQILDVQGTVRSTNMTDTGVLSAVLKTNASGNLVAATAGTDYAAATSGNNLLFGNGAGGFTNVSNTATAGGNIGINSANPGQILDIQGTLRTTTFTMSGQTPVAGYVLTAVNSAGAATWTAAGSVGPWTQTGAIIDETGNNVGIGSTNPGQALDIQGTVRATGLTLTAGAASGYILETNGVGIGTWVPAPTGTATSGSNLLFGNGSGGFTNVTNTTTSGGNIGINSANPGQILDIQGTLRTTTFTMSGQTPVAGYVLTAVNSAGAATWTAAGSVGPWTQTGAIIDETGNNIGIGSNNPGQSLDVQGTVRATGFSLTGNNAATGFILESNGATGIGTWVPEPVGSPAGSNPQLQFNNNGSFGGVSGSGVDANGNVGIGSATPGQKFDVQGTVRAANMTDAGVVSAILKTDASGNLVPAVAGTNYAAATTSSNLLFGNGSGGFTNVTNTATSGGNIGIGSANPGQIFDVQGTVRTTGFTMSGQTPVSGYVLTASDSFGNSSWTPAGSVGPWTQTGSVIFETGNNVGIGTVAPQANLMLSGTMGLQPSTTTNVTAGGGITVTRSIMLIQGSGGAVTVTANPQIAAGVGGQIVVLEGASNSNTVTLANGNGLKLADGVSFTFGSGKTMTMMYDVANSLWTEIARSDN